MSDAGEGARRALEDYRAKMESELKPRLRGRRTGAEYGTPWGDPDSGILLVLEPPETHAVLDALRRSLDSVGHPHARVVPADDRLLEEILSGGPTVIATIGPRAARALDELEYPLAHDRFSESPEAEWFDWSKGTRGLTLPALAPALEDEETKRSFWRAFLTLRGLSTA